ncbi:MAG TPA: tetratricopeptide repeat protein, partial [Planctomycetota bacterium]|nr:tetratricopeptide repeat protein [Planctomycetota bacterium]
MSIPTRRCFPAARTPLAPFLGAGLLPGACFVLGAVLAAFSPSAAHAAQETAEDGFLALIVRSPLERSGDLDALAARWLEELPRHAADFRAELLLRRLSRLPPTLRKPSDLIPLAEKALEASFESGVTRQVLIDVLIDLYRAAGREDDRRRLQKDRGHLLDWLVTGPFGKGKRSHFLEAYPPELEQRLEGVYRDGWQDLSWRKAVRFEEEPQIDPSDFVYPSNGVTYFLSQVKSDRELDALLQRGAPRRIQIWLNGVRMADDDPEETPMPVRRATAVRLAAGWNRILVKSRNPFWIRLCDAAGHTFPPGTLLEEKAAVIHEAASPVGDARDVPFGALGPWEEWIGKLEKAGSPPLVLAEARVGLALLEEAYGRADLAIANLEKAAAGIEEDSLLLLHAAQIHRHAEYLPPTIAKNRSKDVLEKALALDPALVPAYERVARILEEDEKPALAAAKLKEGLERAPMSLALLLRLRSIYSRAKWAADEIDALRRIEEAAPSSSIPSSFWVEHYERLGNIPEAVARGRRVLELDPGDARHHWRLGGLERKRGDLEGAEAAYRAAIRLAPNSDGYRAYLARFLIGTGRAADALEILTPMAERQPLDPGPRKLLAEARIAMGDDAGAAALHQEALALDPGDIALGRYVASRPRTRGASPAPSTGAGTVSAAPGAIEGPDAFWAPHDVRLEDWIPQVPDSGPLVDKASSIIVIDIMVLRLERDGSRSEYVHQASKLLSEQSKEELANVQTQGEILKLRTLTPSGETLEPVAGEGKRSFVMPGLLPGAFVEFAYRDDDASNHGAPVNTPAFYFQDMRFTQSFLLSRLVVLIPKGLDVGFLENNVLADSPERAGTAGGDSVEFARVEKTVVEREDGTTVVTYEARNVPRLEREQGVPASQEYIPNVEVLQKLTWGEIAGQMRERYQRGARPTPELARAAADATAGIEGPLDRAKALYDHVNQIIPTEGGSSSAVATLLQKAGSRN